MTTLFTAIFYLWLVLTILLVAMWILREQDRRRKDQQETALEQELLTGDRMIAAEPEPETEAVSPPAEAETAAPEASVTAVEDSNEPDSADPSEPDTDSSGDESDSADEAHEAEELTDGDHEVDDVDGAHDVEPAGEPVPGPSELPGILDLLDGVTLPHDLTPLTARIEDPNRHAIFISPNPDAAEVGTAFADELAAQGFEIEAAGFDQALATRGPDVLSMRISPEAGSVTDGDEPRYPSADTDDVAIEVWLGNGNPPTLSS